MWDEWKREKKTQHTIPLSVVIKTNDVSKDCVSFCVGVVGAISWKQQTKKMNCKHHIRNVGDSALNGKWIRQKSLPNAFGMPPKNLHILIGNHFRLIHKIFIRIQMVCWTSPTNEIESTDCESESESKWNKSSHTKKYKVKNVRSKLYPNLML